MWSHITMTLDFVCGFWNGLSENNIYTRIDSVKICATENE